LHIALKREVPEAMKPRKIEIGTMQADDRDGQRTIENKAA